MKIILCGACGRMGGEVTRLCEERGETVVCGVDISPKPVPYPLYPSFEKVKEEADVIIDFSSAAGLKERLLFAEIRRLPILLAATGYSAEDEALVKEFSARIPIFKTGNLSLGVNLLELLVKKAAKTLGSGFDIEIVERHHSGKKDAPSGTALMLAKAAQEGRGDVSERVYGRHGMVGARQKGEIGIHAVRGGNVVGEHEVGFYGEDEIVILSHSARSRRVFANGALCAAKWLLGREAGLYDMDDLLFDLTP